LDLESINMKFYFTSSMRLIFFCRMAVDDFCYAWGGVSYFLRA